MCLIADTLNGEQIQLVFLLHAIPGQGNAVFRVNALILSFWPHKSSDVKAETCSFGSIIERLNAREDVFAQASHVVIIFASQGSIIKHMKCS